MKYVVTCTVLIATLSCSVALAEDPASGIWKSAPVEGHYSYVQIEECGDRMCGKILKLFDEDDIQVDSEIVGTQVIWDMMPADEGIYNDGKVLRVANGKTYSGKMEIEGDILTVSGCFMLICQGQELTRVTDQ